MRQIEAAKSSRKVVKQDFSTTGISASRIPYATLPGQQKNRPLFAAGVKFIVHLTCPKHPYYSPCLLLFARQFCLFLPGILQFLHPARFLNRIFQSKVRVCAHRHTDVAVAHKVLQRLRVHACSRLDAAVSMTAHMRRDVGNKVRWVYR